MKKLTEKEARYCAYLEERGKSIPANWQQAWLTVRARYVSTPLPSPAPASEPQAQPQAIEYVPFVPPPGATAADVRALLGPERTAVIQGWLDELRAVFGPGVEVDQVYVPKGLQ